MSSIYTIRIRKKKPIQPIQRLFSTPSRGRCINFCLVYILFFDKKAYFSSKSRLCSKLTSKVKVISLMLFLVYFLLTLNITISFSSVICKQAFFCLRMATIVVLTVTIYINTTVIMTMTMIML